jgi:peptidylprolyl isomerase
MLQRVLRLAVIVSIVPSAIVALRFSRTTDAVSVVSGFSRTTDAVSVVSGFSRTNDDVAQPNAAAPKQAVVETTAGTFVIDLTPQSAPNQTAYFIKTAADGGYDGTIFHRAIKYGMVQGGDPLTKDPSKRALYGTGGLNAVKAEVRAPKMTRGSVAAVTIPGKPDSAGAQFFIVLADQPALDNQYTVFGRVVDGIDVIDKIEAVPVNGETPVDRVEVTRVTVQ